MRITAVGVRRFRGISLVELLLALMAMMILSSLGWKAATTAINRCTNSRVTAELGTIDRAMTDFAVQFGDYPPDFHDTIAVWKFLKGRFPKCPQQKYPDMCGQSPATALCFWLAGPDGAGFSTNPADPFKKGGPRIGPFYKFIPEQLQRVDGLMQYFPPRGLKGSPYVYFRGGTKGYEGHPGWGSARPYKSSKDGKWINRDTYQVLSPGVDGKFGSGFHFPNGPDYDQANLDDMANFTRGDTMADAKPKTVVEKPKE
jgi:Tfp pilus assembly protein PilE